MKNRNVALMAGRIQEFSKDQMRIFVMSLGGSAAARLLSELEKIRPMITRSVEANKRSKSQ